MTAYVVTEGALDKDILKLLISQDLSGDVEIVDGGSLSGATSMARSLLVRRRVPVALVADAHSTSPELIEERELGLRGLLENISADTPSKVILVVPELEGIFFEAPSILERILGIEIPATTVVLAQASSEKALGELLQKQRKYQSLRDLLDALSPADLAQLRETKPIAELNRFLHRAQTQTGAGAAH
jgi:hypothetical protein